MYYVVDIESTSKTHGTVQATDAENPQGRALLLFQIFGSILAGSALRKGNHSTRKTLIVGPVIYPAVLTSALRAGRNERDAATPIPIVAPATNSKRKICGTLCNQGTTPATKIEIEYMSCAD